MVSNDDIVSGYFENQAYEVYYNTSIGTTGSDQYIIVDIPDGKIWDIYVVETETNVPTIHHQYVGNGTNQVHINDDTLNSKVRMVTPLPRPMSLDDTMQLIAVGIATTGLSYISIFVLYNERDK